MGMGEEGMEAVGEFLKVGEKLEMVDLGENSISEKAAQYLSEGIQQNKSRKLKHLNLKVRAEKNQRLSDEKAKVIEQAIKSHLGIEKIILGIYSLVFWDIYIYIYRWLEYPTRAEGLYSRNPRKKIEYKGLANHFLYDSLQYIY